MLSIASQLYRRNKNSLSCGPQIYTEYYNAHTNNEKNYWRFGQFSERSLERALLFCACKKPSVLCYRNPVHQYSHVHKWKNLLEDYFKLKKVHNFGAAFKIEDVILNILFLWFNQGNILMRM